MAEDDAAPSEQLEPQSTAIDIDSATDAEAEPAIVQRGPSHVTLALIAGLVAVLVLGGLTGWLGYRAHESRALDQQRLTFLEVGRQGAINLTTLNFEEIDADVQRILDSATGTFYDDFQQRAPAFAQVVRQVKSKSVGTVTEAALEAGDTATQAEVLVAVAVKTAIVGQPDQQPRAWRMRIQVQKVQGETKVANVEFVA